jgi:hypothetical protein
LSFEQPPEVPNRGLGNDEHIDTHRFDLGKSSGGPPRDNPHRPRTRIAATVWYIRRRRARKLRPQIALEALNQRYALGDIGRTEYLKNRDDILAAQRAASAASASSRQ